MEQHVLECMQPGRAEQAKRDQTASQSRSRYFGLMHRVTLLILTSPNLSIVGTTLTAVKDLGGGVIITSAETRNERLQNDWRRLCRRRVYTFYTTFSQRRWFALAKTASQTFWVSKASRKVGATGCPLA